MRLPNVFSWLVGDNDECETCFDFAPVPDDNNVDVVEGVVSCKEDSSADVTLVRGDFAESVVFVVAALKAGAVKPGVAAAPYGFSCWTLLNNTQKITI